MDRPSNRKRELLDPVPKYKKALRDPAKVIFGTVFLLLCLIPNIILAGIRKLFREKKSVAGKVCLVTGAGRGIGRGLALSMAQEGARVICVDVHEKNNAETVRLIRESGGEAESRITNVGIYEEVQALGRAVGEIDILVNNAALVAGISVSDWNQQEISAAYKVNVLAHYWTMMTFLPAMRRRNSGHIVTISSISAFSQAPYLTIYGATKAAIGNLTQSVNLELNVLNRDNEVKFTTIYPYFVNTSEDYIKCCTLRSPPLEVSEAVERMMSAILYEETEVSIPSHFFYILNIVKMLPASVSETLLELLVISFSSHSLEERRSLPYYDIVDSLNK